MGWTFINGKSRADIIRDCTADHELVGGGRLRTLRKSFRGNTMYTLLEMQSRDGTTTKFIGVTLLQRSGDAWGYKDMDETAEPFYYDCPLSFLDEADAPSCESATKWRQTVRDRAAADAAKRPEVGQTWQLTDGCRPGQVKISSLKPLQGVANGITFRIPRRMLATVVEGA